jgi:hypothetical protein
LSAKGKSNLLIENTSTIDESPNGLDDMDTTISDIKSSCCVAIDILNDLLIYDKIESGNLVLERKYIYIMEHLIDWLIPFKMQVFTHITYIQQL